MKARVTTLIENTSGEHLALHVQHGVSFLFETDNAVVLFDTGQDGRFIENARKLNLDLSLVDHVVLSHGHYDHANGLPYFASEYGTDFELWTHPDLFVPKYAVDGAAFTYLGPSFDAKWLQASGVRHNAVTERVTEIAPDVFLVTRFGKYNDLEDTNPRFVLPDGDEGWKVDDFHDEVSVVVRTSKGLVVGVGCSHPGIMNMLSTIRDEFSEPIHALLGGSHLVEADGERLDAAVKRLTAVDIAVLGLNHCTGEEAMELLDARSPGFYRNATGISLVV